MEVDSKIILSSDRLGYPNSALPIRNNYYSFPSASYFDFINDYTISVWLKFNDFENTAIILHFREETFHDEVILSFKSLNTIEFNGNYFTIKSDQETMLHNWFHLAVTSENDNVHVYINGEMADRTFNTNYYFEDLTEQKFSNFDLDELKIINGVLSKEKIKTEMYSRFIPYVTQII